MKRFKLICLDIVFFIGFSMIAVGLWIYHPITALVVVGAFIMILSSIIVNRIKDGGNS